MIEYDQNLPQSFSQEKNRIRGGGLVIALALAAALLVYALVTLLPFVSRHQL
jgi:hypothetical protein